MSREYTIRGLSKDVVEVGIDSDRKHVLMSVVEFRKFSVEMDATDIFLTPAGAKRLIDRLQRIVDKIEKTEVGDESK